MTFKDIFPGLSRTLSFNFEDFPGPKWFSRTFQVLEFSRKKIQDFPGGVGSLAVGVTHCWCSPADDTLIHCTSDSSPCSPANTSVPRPHGQPLTCRRWLVQWTGHDHRGTTAAKSCSEPAAELCPRWTGLHWPPDEFAGSTCPSSDPARSHQHVLH